MPANLLKVAALDPKDVGLNAVSFDVLVNSVT